MRLWDRSVWFIWLYGCHQLTVIKCSSRSRYPYCEAPQFTVEMVAVIYKAERTCPVSVSDNLWTWRLLSSLSPVYWPSLWPSVADDLVDDPVDALEDVLEDDLPEVSEVMADCLDNVAVQPPALTAVAPPVLTALRPRGPDVERSLVLTTFPPAPLRPALTATLPWTVTATLSVPRSWDAAVTGQLWRGDDQGVLMETSLSALMLTAPRLRQESCVAMFMFTLLLFMFSSQQIIRKYTEYLECIILETQANTSAWFFSTIGVRVPNCHNL